MTKLRFHGSVTRQGFRFDSQIANSLDDFRYMSEITNIRFQSGQRTTDDQQ